MNPDVCGCHPIPDSPEIDLLVCLFCLGMLLLFIAMWIYDLRSGKQKFVLFNNTDNIPGPSNQSFRSRQAASEFLEKWRNTMQEQQGYYRTSRGWRIPVDEVDIEIIPITKKARAQSRNLFQNA